MIGGFPGYRIFLESRNAPTPSFGRWSGSAVVVGLVIFLVTKYLR
jgi:hypothetical protein